ncbi:MAG: dTMP kinase [Candidatus Lokiarchaeota archaeon]|nr:dTMP kinase [Candidatus Lokiarchaeota archaeon]MBD3340718.1 dTMP kinase [Candidatus Lokiarchaeota archaeon]
MRPIFCVIDGIDGAGTTTHSKLLVHYLENRGIKTHLTQEPSHNPIGLLIRNILKDENVPPATDALLFAADRNLHYHNEIRKKLDEGYTVISDRYIESSIIYQSLQSKDITIDWVKSINKFVGEADLTIILDIDPRISLKRKKKQDLEKFEKTEFLAKVRNLYLERAKQNEYHVISSDDEITIVQQKIKKIFSNILKE